MCRSIGGRGMCGTGAGIVSTGTTIIITTAIIASFRC
jgi:hypothetical protein